MKPRNAQPNPQGRCMAMTITMQPKERPLPPLPVVGSEVFATTRIALDGKSFGVPCTTDIADTAAACMGVYIKRPRRAANSCCISSHGKTIAFGLRIAILSYTLQLGALSTLQMQYRRALCATLDIESIRRFLYPHRAEGLLQCIRVTVHAAGIAANHWHGIAKRRRPQLASNRRFMPRITTRASNGMALLYVGYNNIFLSPSKQNVSQLISTRSDVSSSSNLSFRFISSPSPSFIIGPGGCWQQRCSQYSCLLRYLSSVVL